MLFRFRMVKKLKKTTQKKRKTGNQKKARRGGRRILGLVVIIIIIFLTVKLFQESLPRKGELKLLAVKEIGGEKLEGSLADLYLEIRPGEGRVFLDTFPLTKLDTQVSTRRAKRIACQQTKKDCQKYDFFYTIRSDSVIVGGPSAGAAIAALTMAVLEDENYEEKTAITGTINSGGMVGSVGGLKEKIEAASQGGLTKVIVPDFETIKSAGLINNSNMTKNNATNESGTILDIEEYGKEKGIKVVRVSWLEEVVKELTGKGVERKKGELEMGIYNQVMGQIAMRLANRTKRLGRIELVVDEELIKDVNQSFWQWKEGNESKSVENFLNETGISEERWGKFLEERRKKQNYERAEKAKEEGEKALEEGKYYSAASFFYQANINYQTLLINAVKKKGKIEDLEKIRKEKILEIGELKSRAEAIFKEKITLTSLQTYLVVTERLEEAENLLRKVELGSGNTSWESQQALAQGLERINSAKVWSKFFELKGEEVQLEAERLKESCLEKKSEADELYQYLLMFVPELESVKKEIDRAEESRKKIDYAMCLHYSSLAKAKADNIISLIGLTEEQIQPMIEKRLEAAKQGLLKQQQKGSLPILGYSYYQYAQSLRDEDSPSALLFASYALELSNLDQYFPEARKQGLNLTIRMILIWVLGIILMMVLYYVFRE